MVAVPARPASDLAGNHRNVADFPAHRLDHRLEVAGVILGELFGRGLRRIRLALVPQNGDEASVRLCGPRALQGDAKVRPAPALLARRPAHERTSPHGARNYAHALAGMVLEVKLNEVVHWPHRRHLLVEVVRRLRGDPLHVPVELVRARHHRPVLFGRLCAPGHVGLPDAEDELHVLRRVHRLLGGVARELSARLVPRDFLRA